MDKIAIEQLKPNDWNPNRMTDEGFAELVAELQHLGKPAKPIVLRQNGKGYEIIDGEHTYRALIDLGHEDLLPGWYEIEQYDDFEAMRQTYKRNQHGTHDPVLQGRLFQRMMNERGLSKRALAEEIELSEGTVRNSLEYAKAADVRNDYAFSDLSVKQIRAYNRLPQAVADLWLDCGANLKVLYFDASRMSLAKLQTFEDAMKYNYRDHKEAEEGALEYIGELGCLLDLMPTLCYGIRRPESFAKAIEKVQALDNACRIYDRRWGRNRSAIGEKRVAREVAFPYLKVLAGIRWQGIDSIKEFERHHSWILEKIIKVVDDELKIVVPFDAFETWVVGDKRDWRHAGELRDVLDVLVSKFAPELRKQSVRDELMEIELREGAPPQIKDAAGVSTWDKYQLWEATVKYPQIVEQAGDKFPYDLMPEAVNTAVKELQRLAMVEKKVEEMMNTDYMAALQLSQMNHKPSMFDLLVRCINGLIEEQNKKVKDRMFKDKSSLIETILKDATESHTVKEGTIGGKNAGVVLAERLSMIELPELMLMVGYMLNDIAGVNRWFNQMGGKVEKHQESGG